MKEFQYLKMMLKKKKARQAKLKKLLGKNYHIYDKYTKNSLTDGQGYRTLSSYRKVLGMARKWTPEMENAYNEIQAIGNKYGRDMNIPASETQRIADLAVVFQPLKPYLYTMENLAVNEKDAVKIPVQHKYAEAVLIPELLPANSKLREMAYWMERHRDEDGKPAPIDLVVSTKVVKVGNFGATDINSLEKGYVHQLNYNDYRIQTNVPEHLYDSRLFGTQIRKIIMARINLTKDYSNYLDGKIPRLYKNAKINQLNGKKFNIFL